MALPREFRIGDVVEITSTKCPAFINKQGVIIAIDRENPHEDGPIQVRFPVIYRDLGRWIGDTEKYSVWFEPTDFQFRPGGFCFPPKEEGMYLFKDMAHTYAWPKFGLLYNGSSCQFEDCEKRASFEIWHNFLGTASKYYVCAEHAAYHGICGECDDFRIPMIEVASEIGRLLSITERARKVFGENWVVKRPNTFFIPNETVCAHQDCEKTAAFQILLNVHGSIYQMDACRDHVNLHGDRIDGYGPYQPEASQAGFVVEGKIDVNELAMA